MNQLILQLTLRTEVPVGIKALLFLLLATIAILYVLNVRWFESIGYLLLLPVQRFKWQSEQFSGNALFRGSSFTLFAVAFSLFVYIYGLDTLNPASNSYPFFVLLIMFLALALIKVAFNYAYFFLHKSNDLGAKLIDFQSSTNQLFCLVLTPLMLIDVFYTGISGDLVYVAIGLAVIYLLVRLYGTILLLQDNFRYPIVSLFVYLCTFELAPALVLAKVLFVKS